MSDTHKHLIEFAESAVKMAQDVRNFHRKRSRVGTVHRNTDIKHAERRLREAMKPIRSALGRAPYDPVSPETDKQHEELREMSQRIQSERRKLWKLRNGGSLKRGPRGGRKRSPWQVTGRP